MTTNRNGGASPLPEQPPGPAPFDWRGLAVRLVGLLLVGGLTTGAIVAELRPALLFIAGGGGGWLASRFLSWARAEAGGGYGLRVWARDNWHAPAAAPRLAARVVGWAIYSPATAALSVAVLGAVLSGAATALLAALSGAPLSEAWAAFVAFVISQLVYFSQRTPRERAPRP